MRKGAAPPMGGQLILESKLCPPWQNLVDTPLSYGTDETRGVRCDVRDRCVSEVPVGDVCTGGGCVLDVTQLEVMSGRHPKKR